MQYILEVTCLTPALRGSEPVQTGSCQPFNSVSGTFAALSPRTHLIMELKTQIHPGSEWRNKLISSISLSLHTHYLLFRKCLHPAGGHTITTEKLRIC